MVHHFEQLEQQTKISAETQVIIDAIVLETTIYLSLMYMMIVANKNDPAFAVVFGKRLLTKQMNCPTFQHFYFIPLLSWRKLIDRDFQLKRYIVYNLVTLGIVESNLCNNW